MNKRKLKLWLKAGYMEKGMYHPTTEGTPQGGINKQISERIFSDQGPIVSAAIAVLAIFVAAGITWWIFNAVIGKFEKKYCARPFFAKNDAIFMLIKRAGHYSILILAGIALVNQFQAPMIERAFFAFLILWVNTTNSANSANNSGGHNYGKTHYQRDYGGCCSQVTAKNRP